MSKEVIRQLVDALKEQPRKTYEQGPYDINVPVYYTELRDAAIAAGEAELAKPDPEPVMWGSWAWDGMKNVCVPAHPPKDGKERPKLFPLYTTQPAPSPEYKEQP